LGVKLVAQIERLLNVLTQARSAACMGCSSSIASGMPTRRVVGEAAMPSRTWLRASVISIE
jgi:hypothetical protein